MKCPICNFSYNRKTSDDIKIHNTYHDHFLYGIPVQNIDIYPFKQIDDKFIILILNQLISFEKRKIAQELAIFPMHETKFMGLPYNAHENLDERNVHALLLIKDLRAIGLIVIELRSEIWLTNWTDYYNKKTKKLINHKPIWSVSMVWIAKSFRRRGYCKLFIEKSLEIFNTNTQKVGWYTPFTKSGEFFVKSICQNEFFIAK